MQGSTVAEFYRQLAMLVRSDLPLPESVRQLSEVLGSRQFRRTLAEVGDATADGSSLSAAMAQHPAEFRPIYVRLVQAGESGNVLADVLDELTHSAATGHDFLRRTREAISYPLTAILATGYIALALTRWTIPTFQGMFDEMLGGQRLPPITRFVFAISDMINSAWVPCLVALIIATVLAFVSMIDAAAMNRLAYRIIGVLPGFRRVAISADYARVARLLAVSMQHQLPLADTLELLRDTAETTDLRTRLGVWAERCAAGETLKDIAATDSWIDGLMKLAILHGEEAELPTNLLELSEVYETRAASARRGAIMIWTMISYTIMALTIGGFIFASLLPLLKLVDTLGG